MLFGRGGFLCQWEGRRWAIEPEEANLEKNSMRAKKGVWRKKV
jgi:hypothetical protein